MRAIALLVLLTMPVLTMPAFAQPQQRPFLELVRGSGLIFQGTIKAIGQATPGVTAQPNTAVVTVDRVLEALPPIGSPRGDVTVRLRNPNQMRPGQTATFFTFVYSAAATLGLEEVGTLPREEPAAVERRIREARQSLADEALGKRLTSARLVVAGEIGEPAPDPDTRQPVSEHDPAWRLTPIQVESFLKGAQANQPVAVNVSHSTDIVWRRAPKPAPGSKGIFLLQPDPGPDHWSRITGLFLVDPLDALPSNELERVRRLLRIQR